VLAWAKSEIGGSDKETLDRLVGPEGLHFLYAEQQRGGWDPEARLGDLDIDGVDIEILFPTTGMNLYTIENQQLRSELFRAYNEWLTIFCAHTPERYKGIALVDPEALVDPLSALRQLREAGMVGVMIPLFPASEGSYRDGSLDPFWQAAEQLDLPVNLHSSTFRDPSHGVFNQSLFSTRLLNTPFQIQRVLLDFIFSGTLDRYPGLRIVSAENDAGWVAFTVERGDYWWDRFKEGWEPMLQGLAARGGVYCEHPPSYYVRRNFKFTFMRDRSALLNREIIGIETLMWGSDFPHHITTFPDSQNLFREYQKDLGDEELERVISANAKDLYHL